VLAVVAVGITLLMEAQVALHKQRYWLHQVMYIGSLLENQVDTEISEMRKVRALDISTHREILFGSQRHGSMELAAADPE
jgi:hypothetical protein